jgi:hypothetical protein
VSSGNKVVHLRKSEVCLLAYFVTMQQECESICCGCRQGCAGAIKECFARLQRRSYRQSRFSSACVDACGSSAQAHRNNGLGLIPKTLLQGMIEFYWCSALFCR